MPAQRFPATRIRRNRRWIAAGLSPLLISVAAIVAAFLTKSTEVLRMIHVGIILALIASVRVWTKNPAPRIDGGEVTIEGDEVRFGDELLALRSRISRASWREDPSHGAIVQIQTGRLSPSIQLAVPTADAARELVAALGFGPSQRVVTFAGTSQAMTFSLPRRTATVLAAMLLPIGVAVASRAALGAHAPGWMAPVAVAAFVVSVISVLAWQMVPSRIDVGADGVLVRWLGQRTFIPWADVEAVAPLEVGEGAKAYLGVQLVMRDGPTRRLLVGPTSMGTEPRELLLARMEESLAVHRRGGPVADVARLARHGRDHAAWLASLRTLGTGADGGPRDAPVPLEHLWSLVEGAGHDALARAAAAIALARSASPDERERIRIVARASAEPRLRIALERAADADADDAALVEAVAELEAAAGAERQRIGATPHAS